MPNQMVTVIVLAHQEERRIGACLASLPLGDPLVDVHVVVNGSTDRTAAIARGFDGVTVHDWPEGGKARSWNRIVLDTAQITADAYVFVDGDAEVLPGSVDALVATLDANPIANAVAGMPYNGRRAQAYREEMLHSHGLFGDLYALRGSFVERMRSAAIRLPEDLIGDDGLICAMAKTDLANEDEWLDERVVPCADAGFLCEVTSLASPATLIGQYHRMVNYSVRHFQNRIVSELMCNQGPRALPQTLADLYGFWLSRLNPRRHPVWYWFDRQALAKMRRGV